MLLPEKIESSETKYKSKLEEFFSEIYDASLLPSHGIDHHKRVWYYAVEILNQLNDHGFKIVFSFFDSYNQQVPFYKFENKLVSGYCGVAEIIRQILNGDKAEVSTNLQVSDYPDPVIQWFFAELKNELSE